MENSTLLENSSVSDIVKSGVSSYLNKNKNINLGDLTSAERRKKAGNQLKSTLKSTVLDTGQNVINHLRKEDVSRFDKLVKTIKGTPNLSSEKTASLLKIAGKVRGIKEFRVFKEGIGTMTDADIERTGATPEMQAKVKAKRDAKLKNQKPTTQKSSGETKQLPGQKGISGSDNNKSLKSGKDKKDTSSSSNKGGAIVKSKGSDLANRGNKNTEVKDKRDPKTYRNKKGEGIKVPWKKVGSAARKGAEAAGRIAQSAVGAATAGYGQSSFRTEEVSRRHKPSAIKKKAKLEKALATLKLKKKKINERFGQWKQAVKDGVIKRGVTTTGNAPKKKKKKKTRKQKWREGGNEKLKNVNKAAEKQSIQRVGGSRGVHTANRKSKAAQGKQAPVVYSYKKKTNEAALALPLIPLANQAIATGAAAWSLYNMSKKKSPGQKNIPGFQRTWGKSKPNPVRDKLNQARDASKTRKVNQAQSDAARARENAARRSRGEGELPQN